MGFGRQLTLLLWKNFTLKKRAPLAVLFEVLIPLVLFLILMGIRLRREPHPKPEEIFPVRALPSSGIIPLLQQFCPNKITDEHGFPVHVNSSIGSILADLSDILHSPSLSTIDNLKNIPQDYKDLKNDYDSLEIRVSTIKNFTLHDVLTDSTKLQKLLSNFSVPNSLSDGLLNSTVSGSEIQSLLSTGTQAGNIFGTHPFQLHHLRHISGKAGILTLLAAMMGMNKMLNSSLFTNPIKHRPQFTHNKLQHIKENYTAQTCTIKELRRTIFLHIQTKQYSTHSPCSLTPTQIQEVRKTIVSEIDTKRLLGKLNLTQTDLDKFNQTLNHLRRDIGNVSSFVELVQKGYHLASLLQLNMSFAEGLQNKSAHGRRTAYIRGMWRNLGPILCGPSPAEQPNKAVKHMFDFHCLTHSCTTRALRLMFYLMTHNPKILYAPNGTAADDVIKEANRTFSDIDSLQNVAKEWMNHSSQFRAILVQNDTQHYLRILTEFIKKYPDFFFGTASDISGHDAASHLRYYRDIHKLLTGKHGAASPILRELDKIDAVLKVWLKQTERMQLNIFVGFKDEQALVDYAFNNSGLRSADSKIVAGIVFDNLKPNSSLPPHVTYKIRMNATYFTPRTDRIRDNYWRPGPQSWGQSYYDLGFVWLQDQIERAIVDLHSNREVIKPAVYMHEMPYPCYARDRFMFVIQHMMPLCMTVSWIYTVAIVVRSIVYEKEQRLKEVMKMMGLSNVVHWVAWFITSMSVMSITVLLLTVILKYGKVLAFSDPLIIWLSLMLFAIVTIVFCFLISAFFSKAKLAAACGGIIYFLTYMPFVFISIREGAGHVTINIPEKMAASLLSTSAFGLGARYFALYEEQGEGVQWHNIGASPIKGDEFTLLKVLYFLVFDTFLYIILVWYIEAVHPGSYGLPRPWYFPVQPSYWFGHNTKACQKFSRKNFSPMDTNDDLEEAPRTPGLLAYENEPIHLPLGVTIDHLEKVYKSGIKAVDGLALNLYEGQITSFLGHNGAGKTTTMSILTGLFPPTSGTAYIYGEDIRFDMDGIRHNLGMCPQHNVLFDRLTVDEHLWFYARMKGINSAQVRKEMNQLVKDVGLPNKRHCAVETLSGGMKRKLSVAMAFVGGSRTVILDEPTAGVDPYARRAIWDLLIKYKKGRTILLSTHFMEEADILGDRIAIISNGKLRCVGSPLFLKSRFGEGYSLTLVRKKDRSPRGSSCDLAAATDIRSPFSSMLSIDSNTQEEKVTNFITSHIPAAQLQNKTQQEFTFILPDNSVKRGTFEKLFADLEANMEVLGIDSYGITDTSLEEVFLKVTDKSSSDSDDSITSQESLNLESNGDDGLELNTVTNTTCDDNERLLPRVPSTGDHIGRQNVPSNAPGGIGSYTLIGSALKWQQFYALILKRFHHARRNFKGVISQILLPAIFISIAMTMALSLPPTPDLPPLQLSPSMFPRDNYIPFGNEAKGRNRLAEGLERTLTLPSGVGATCCLQSTKYIAKNNNTQLSKDQLAKLFDESCRKAIDDVSSVYLKPSSAKFKYIYTNGSADLSESVTHNDTGRGCQCSANGTWYNCQKGAAGTWPKELKTITLDTLQNVTGRNMSKYLLYTTQTFREHRYGGLSFGNVVKFVPKNFNSIPIAAVRRLAVREAVKSWYNNKGYHALPTYLNVMNNAILRTSLGKDKGNPAAYGITAYNHPFPFNGSSHHHLSAEYLQQGTDLVIAIFVIIAMSFVPASFVVFIVTERSSKAKHLQFVSGVNPIVYWFANYLWDMCNYLIPALACISLLYVFNVPAYASTTNFPAVVCLFMLYGWSITPIMYPCAFWFNEASSAYVAMIVINLFVGITATVSTFILQLFPDDEVLTDINSVLKDISLGFPNYCLGRGLMDLAYNQYMTDYYIQVGENDKIQSPFEWMIVTRNLVFMFFEGIVFFILTILIEYRFFLKPRRLPVSKVPIQNEDEDVAAERERVFRGDAMNDLVRIENLTKVYRSRKRGKHLAVDRLCLGIPQGECFGLLGVNGAGKTSTFKMLTGDTSMTAGDAVLNTYRISTDIHKVYSCIGYCPQFDALIDEMTAEEQIYLYARLRGVPEKELKQVSAWAVKKLGLSSYAKYPCKAYSGGNKRKLSTAIALIGNPPIIFLDEPTTGMDPHARRFLWNLILSIIKDGRSVVLTSHSMEECEALCSRLAIMVNGRFKCLGSCQHLKNRFGEGYIVTLRIQGDLPDMSPVMDYFKHNLPLATLKEHHHNMLQYQIPSGVVSLSKLFGLIESSQDALCIEDYSVSQTTLDNVFVNFASQQKDESEYDEQSLGLSTHESRGLGRLPSMLHDTNIRFSTLQEDEEDDFQVSFDATSRLVFNEPSEA